MSSASASSLLARPAALLPRAVLGAALACLTTAWCHAQNVPHPGHALSDASGRALQAGGGGMSTELTTAAIGHPVQGRGLTLANPDTTSLWPHWEGRIGVVLDRGNDGLSNPFALSPTVSTGLKMHSLHLLSDYYFAGGFRATAGLVRGSTNLPWWPSSQQGNTGLNLSLQRIDLLNVPGQERSTLSEDPYRTVPYVGAGYSTRLTESSGVGSWQFNADLGIISLNSRNFDRVRNVFQGEQGIEELIRELRLRPVIKFSVNYAF